MSVEGAGGHHGSWLRATALVLAVVVVLTPAVGAEARSPADCPVTRPNDNMPSPTLLETFGMPRTAEPLQGYYHGNGQLWVGMWWPDGVIRSPYVHFAADGTLAVKTPWFRGPDTRGQLVITGRRLDVAAPTLRFEGMPSYGGASVEVSSVNYPTPGCWELTGTVGDTDHSLTFVTLVVFEPPVPKHAVVDDGMAPLARPGCPLTTNEDDAGGIPEAKRPVPRDNGAGTPPVSDPPAEDHWYGENGLWTSLWPDGIYRVSVRSHHLEPDGAFGMKFLWYRDETARGRLVITGQRLDAPAPPLRAHVPKGYGDVGLQASGIIFPTPGCWQVTARSGAATLSFVALVIYEPALTGGSVS